VTVTVSGQEVPDDWAERWKRFHVPVLVGGRLYVRPPWDEAPVRPGVIDLVIDPGRAFGTGSHPTTRLSLELLLAVEVGGSFADLGCGSGVLAIAAAKLGFDPVTGLDADGAAIEETARNARENGVSIELRRADLRSELAPVPAVVAANLTRALLVGVIENPPTVLLASSEDSGIDAGRLLRDVLQQAGGRGGGSTRLAQGTLRDRAGLETVLQALRTAGS
jgi:ribosomal protein L11 methyltransferase